MTKGCNLGCFHEYPIPGASIHADATQQHVTSRTACQALEASSVQGP